jgi:hypothetical protein
MPCVRVVRASASRPGNTSMNDYLSKPDILRDFELVAEHLH